MYYEPSDRSAGQAVLPFNPFKALVAPRPIGWVSTVTEDGMVNLAPYSYFQAVADNPDIVMFSATPGMVPGDKGPVFSGSRKHSETNAVSSREFVCNLVTYELREAMNVTSAHVDAATSEVDLSGLEMAPSRHVRPPRVASAPAALECVVVDHRPVLHRSGEHRYQMVFGEVVGIYIDDRFVNEGRVDTTAMQILTRMGYDEYAVLERSFSMSRPDFDPLLGNR